jgi:hypothetical protein
MIDTAYLPESEHGFAPWDDPGLSGATLSL